MEFDFKIFTLNCWGIPLIAKDLKDRFEAIAEVLAKSDYDCVCLQEVWTEGLYQHIKNKISGSFPYGHYFYSGSLGSGICMFSKYPIIDVYFHQWAVNGYIHKIHHGDWFGGKGVGLCKLRLNKYLVNVYTAHLHAEYNREHDEYKAHRIIQAFDTAQFIQLTSGNADLVVLAGDLNTEPGDLAYKLLLTVPGLTDSFVEAQFSGNIKTTNESLCNSYTPSKLKKQEVCGKRIDYIMFHPGSNSQIYLKKYQMPLEDRVPNRHFSYSDHEAVSVVLHIKDDMAHTPSNHSNEKISALEESIDVLEEELDRLRTHKIFYWLCGIFSFCFFFVTIFIDVPSTFSIPYNIFRSFLAIAALFSICMATIWNSIETSAVLGSLGSMKIIFKN
ncbi:hypothetical protein HHI36_006258 [Cryptolaemus montrouzieri]|uniref:sphingomyelin phosphodiesterase n=1 Tax=Cryptolaemus montrouzieri TaxID=559131 RepID=A0ABD2NWN9_9CUCU